ncbi:acetolactate synthase catalytic subunit [Pseudoroseomonas cervicalis]|uniref:acetolactate synthase catalytic subunit n=1 Tax=Teichococcus cervicalis TaxID=204525 RepID=UPI0027876796|nr:acetolactate synthase catalytic subunit [Pseudoroseomonas cervicalis]MDQ1078167.1 acetolactate synthase-1/2/3 large subunit [Pseudoroseomonas cervicalis]
MDTAVHARPGVNESVAMRLAAAFRRHGVEIVFGQSIPSAFFLAAPQAGIRQATYRAENAGGTMADGYARISGRVGVVAAQNGPAATLLVPPLAEALKASIPVIALVQDVARTTTEKNAFQELDHLRLFDGCTKWARRIDHASRIEEMVELAFVQACGGRPGPVALIIPADLLTETASHAESRRADLGHFPLDRSVADPAGIAEAARLLANARAPLVIAGGGVHASGAAAALAALQEECHLPVATTVMGKGVVAETHPLSLGIVGYFMGDGARGRALRPMVEEADVVLLVGNRTNQNGTDSWKLYPRDARYIQIDIDSGEIGRNYEALRLLGDAKLTLEALHRALLAEGVASRAAARPETERRIAEGVADWRHFTRRIREQDREPIRPERVMQALEDIIDAESIVVADASYSSIWIANYLTARRPGMRFLTPRGLAGLGWGLPLAIGAKMAAPEKKVVCVAGDGGFAHSWAELETARRLGLDIPVLVLNNQILGYQKHAEDTLFGAHTDACDFFPVDHAAIAKACGCHGIRVERAAELDAALREAWAQSGPSLIDIITDPDARPPVTFYDNTYPSPF